MHVKQVSPIALRVVTHTQCVLDAVKELCSKT